MTTLAKVIDELGPGWGAHFVAAETSPADVEAISIPSDWWLYKWSLAGCTDKATVLASAVEAFRITEPVLGYDAFIDWVSDPDYLADLADGMTYNGVVFLIYGLEDLYTHSREDFETVAKIQGNIADRWREGVDAFHVIIAGSRSICEDGEATLRRTNESLAQSKKTMRWLDNVEPVPIYRHYN